MATQITSSGANIKIATTDGSPRYIMKSQIVEVEVLRDTIIKIDIGQGALYNVFIDQEDVTVPANTSVEDLRDKILFMLELGTPSTTGLATEVKQDLEIYELRGLHSVINQLGENISQIKGKIPDEPLLVDEANPNVIYKGFAALGADTKQPQWAIQKITNNRGILSYKWASGNKDFDKIWDNRKTLIYS